MHQGRLCHKAVLLYLHKKCIIVYRRRITTSWRVFLSLKPYSSCCGKSRHLNHAADDSATAPSCFEMSISQRKTAAREERAKGERERNALERDIALLKERSRQVELHKERQRLPRSCNQRKEVAMAPALTPVDFRGEDIFHDLDVEGRPSQIHGRGTFSKNGASKNDVLLSVILPSKAVEKGFASNSDGGYDCNQHVMHKDGLGVMFIDPGARMRGNLGACKEDFKLGVLRLLNHSDDPNIAISTREAAIPDWYEALGEKFTTWYECTLVATRAIGVDEEMTIEYALAPKGIRLAK